MDYFDIDVYSRKITTSSPDAQLWFDRGLVWTYSYNHELAVECFQKALEHDPRCAMAHWGLAYAIGPNYNFEWWMMDPATKLKALGIAHHSTAAARALLAGTCRPGDTVVADTDSVCGTLVFSSESSTVVAEARDRRAARTPSGGEGAGTREERRSTFDPPPRDDEGPDGGPVN